MSRHSLPTRESVAQLRYDPIHAADVALKELVDLCSQLAILIGDEIAPLPQLTLFRLTSVLAAMDAALFTLTHWVDAAGETLPGRGSSPSPADSKRISTPNHKTASNEESPRLTNLPRQPLQ